MQAVDTAIERPAQALSFAVSTTFIRFSVDEWHVLKVGGSSGRRSLRYAGVASIPFNTVCVCVYPATVTEIIERSLVGELLEMTFLSPPPYSTQN